MQDQTSTTWFNYVQVTFFLPQPSTRIVSLLKRPLSNRWPLSGRSCAWAVCHRSWIQSWISSARRFPISEIYEGQAFCVCVLRFWISSKMLIKPYKTSNTQCRPSDLPGRRQGPTVNSHSALLFQSSTFLNLLFAPHQLFLTSIKSNYRFWWIF